MLEIGCIVDGKYKILETIGQGGMSTVYLAINEKANKYWALKEIRCMENKDTKIIKSSITAELYVLRKLRHPNLPTIVDVVDTKDSILIVMDYIKGKTLGSIVTEKGAMNEEQVISWANTLCDILSYLHNQTPPIIYRDLKPDNIMLCQNGEIMMIDFGTAREFKEHHTQDTTCLGTIGYAAPEQYGGTGQTDVRTDIYSLGMTLYHLVTGKNPSNPPYEILPIRKINSKLSARLEHIIDTCIQKNPEKRYQSISQVIHELNTYQILTDEQKQKRKRQQNVFFFLCVTTIISLFFTIGFGIAKSNHNRKTYINQLEVANSIDDYYNAIAFCPTRKEGYLELLQFLLKDGQLKEEEMGALRKLITGIEKVNKNGVSNVLLPLEELKKEDKQVSELVYYEIGQACLFYYNISMEKDRYESAMVWLRESVDSYPMAEIYCSISNCLTKIYQYNTSQVKQTEKKAMEYSRLWTEIEQLIQATKEIEELDTQFEVYRMIVQIINNKIEDFITIIGTMPIIQVLDNIYLTKETKEFLLFQEQETQLEKDIETLIQKIKQLERQKNGF